MTTVPATAWRTRQVEDREEIAAFLRTDRLYAAYALGDLDAASRRRAAWGMAYGEDGRPHGVAMTRIANPAWSRKAGMTTRRRIQRRFDEKSTAIASNATMPSRPIRRSI